jgi:uncharacterized membrane protein YqhA
MTARQKINPRVAWPNSLNTTMQKIIQFRYVLLIAVVVTLVNALFFILSGVAHSIHGYVEFAKIGFLPSEGVHPGLYLLEGLDAFMVSLVFMVFGMGVARLFLFDQMQSDQLPGWLQISDLGELKNLMWKTILFTLVVFSATRLVEYPLYTWETLVFPIIILVLSGAYFLVHATNRP